MQGPLDQIVHDAVARAPQWVRQDMLKEGAERVRAQDALSAIIVGALREAGLVEEGQAAA
jgi:hypothetical protein